MNKKPTYIDLFAGCGGLSLGLHNANWQGLFAIEKNADAFATLKHNLMDKINHFDWPSWLEKKNHNINTILQTKNVKLKGLKGKVDLVTGGPPCQGFSTAGKRNEEDKRNELIKSYIRFIKAVEPKIIFFENVKGFTMEFDKNKSKGKRYSSYVIDKLDKAGYDIESDIIDFSEFGIPQKRCRFILVGVRKDVCENNKRAAKEFFALIKENRKDFLVSKNLEVSVPLEAAISDLLMSNGTANSPDTKHFQAGLYSKEKSKYQSYLRKGKKINTIADSHRFANHRPEIVKRFQLILKFTQEGKNISKATKQAFGIKKHTVVRLNGNTPSPTITTLPDDYVHYCEPRILTVREYARIQSFPDSYEFKGKYTTGGKVRTQEVPRYSQIGNAIPPLFGEQSGLILKQFIQNE